MNPDTFILSHDSHKLTVTKNPYVANSNSGDDHPPPQPAAIICDITDKLGDSHGHGEGENVNEAMQAAVDDFRE